MLLYIRLLGAGCTPCSSHPGKPRQTQAGKWELRALSILLQLCSPRGKNTLALLSPSGSSSCPAALYERDLPENQAKDPFGDFFLYLFHRLPLFCREMAQLQENINGIIATFYTYASSDGDCSTLSRGELRQLIEQEFEDVIMVRIKQHRGAMGMGLCWSD